MRIGIFLETGIVAGTGWSHAICAGLGQGTDHEPLGRDPPQDSPGAEAGELGVNWVNCVNWAVFKTPGG